MTTNEIPLEFSFHSHYTKCFYYCPMLCNHLMCFFVIEHSVNPVPLLVKVFKDLTTYTLYTPMIAETCVFQYNKVMMNCSSSRFLLCLVLESTVKYQNSNARGWS